MAIAAGHLTSSADNTDASSYTTASISPSGSALVLAAVANVHPTAAGTVTLSGNGLTWVEVATVTLDGTERRLTLFRAMGASPSAGAVTITLSNTAESCAWSIVELSGVATGGTNGSAAVVQSATNSAVDAASLVVTLAAFADAVANAAFGAFAKNGSVAIDPGSGFTELGEGAATTPAVRAQSEWKSGQDTSVDASQATGTGNWGGIAVEVAAAAASAGVARHFLHFERLRG